MTLKILKSNKWISELGFLCHKQKAASTTEQVEGGT